MKCSVPRIPRFSAQQKQRKGSRLFDAMNNMAESWRTETDHYNTRLVQLAQQQSDVADLADLKRMPPVPLDYQPSQAGLLAIQLALFSVNCGVMAGQVLDAFSDLWLNRRFVVLSLQSRLLYELWGAIHYAKTEMMRFNQSGNVQQCALAAGKLLLGKGSDKADIQLPWGEVATESAVRVGKFIESLEDAQPLAKKTYAWLSESCHPSLSMHTYWSLMGPPVPNWGNEKFRTHAHDMLDRTFTAIEEAVQGIATDRRETLVLALLYIERDRQRGIHD